MSRGAEISEVDDGFLVVCPEHNLLRGVATGAHAANLQALHNRIDHADDTDSIAVDLTAAARLVTHLAESFDDPAGAVAIEIWQALTGIVLPGDALAHARELAASDPPITAAVPPF